MSRDRYLSAKGLIATGVINKTQYSNVLEMSTNASKAAIDQYNSARLMSEASRAPMGVFTSNPVVQHYHGVSRSDSPDLMLDSIVKHVNYLLKQEESGKLPNVDTVLTFVGSYRSNSGENYIEYVNNRNILQYILQRMIDEIKTMQMATKKRCIYVLKKLINGGANINQINRYGDTVLYTCCTLASEVNDIVGHHAAEAADMYYDLIQFVLQKDVNVNAKGSLENSSPPIFQILEDSVYNARIVKLLIDKGANLEITGAYGLTALQYYCSQSNSQHRPHPVLKVLIKSGAKLKDARSMLHHWEVENAFDEFVGAEKDKPSAGKTGPSKSRKSRREAPYGGVGRRKRTSKTQKRKSRR